MKKFMKFAASVVAATTIVTGAAGVSASAEEYLSDFSEVLAEAESGNSGYTFPAYDSYSTALGPKAHYLAAIKTSAFTFPVTNSTFKVRTYINANVLSENATKLDHFSIGPAYTDCLTLSSVKPSTYSSESKELLLSIGVKATPPVEPENAAVFTYYIDDVFDNDAINSDYDVYLITNAVSASPSSSIPAVMGGTFAKTVYSLGDVNRDGSISNMDALFVLMYVENGGASEDGRTDEQEICDRTAFLLAADYNQDGVVDRTDAEAIMRYVSNSSY